MVTGLHGKHLLLGVTGSIAAYKAAQWVRNLVVEEAEVSVVLTAAATRFVTPLTFAALSQRQVYEDMFADDAEGAMAHINLPRQADLLLIAPASAHTIARLAHGLADDLLTASVLAADRPVVICPAMNAKMFAHPATQANLETLRGYGYHLVEPGTGALACGETGNGRLAGWDRVREQLLALLTPDDLAGKKVLITAGPTREPLDPARYLTNRSSGKMGYALARTAIRRGAEVTLVTGPVQTPPPPGVTLVCVETTEDMRNRVLDLASTQDIIVKAAAVADYRAKAVAAQKLKKRHWDAELRLIETTDILAELGRRKKEGQFLVGFAAESADFLEEGQRKLREKQADLVVVNDILGTDTGFDVDTNQVLLVDGHGAVQVPLLSKEATANRIWSRVVDLCSSRDLQGA
ncbi:MAG: bifunctional phosphopantothenoylcysteine decarboxylase/phosphopantothenate--cysteine ligase CoaBC [Desulfobulbus propionicus]|nr:MAG: bifunctional phosphopantothenoylcysteine decarboxylase/phosphopantothenate--cysteine ligase CoaBC [Desulfobulbus propionicus]